MDNGLQLQESSAGAPQQFVTFRLGPESFGVEINSVQEIIGYRGCTRLPEQPDFMPGVINLRGLVVPVLDLRRRFKMDAKEYDNNTVILVLKIAGRTVGLIVDSVSDVVTLQPEEMQPPPELAGGDGRPDHIMCMGQKGDELLILLDATKLISNGDMPLSMPGAAGLTDYAGGAATL